MRAQTKVDVHLLFVVDNIEKNTILREGISKCITYFLRKEYKIPLAHEIININGNFFTRGVAGFSDSFFAILKNVKNEKLNIKGITLIFVSSCVSINPDYILHTGIHDGEKLVYQAPLDCLNNYLNSVKNENTPHQLLTILFPCTLADKYAKDYKKEAIDDTEYIVPNNILYRLKSLDENDIKQMINFVINEVEIFREKNNLSK